MQGHIDITINRRTRQGFTLMEVLAAMLIFSITVLTVGNLFTYAAQRVSAGREDTEAALYAQEKVEDLINEPDGDTALEAGTYTDDPSDKYTRQWWIHDNNPTVGSKLIVVTVRPKHGQRTKKTTMAVIRP